MSAKADVVVALQRALEARLASLLESPYKQGSAEIARYELRTWRGMTRLERLILADRCIELVRDHLGASCAPSPSAASEGLSVARDELESKVQL